MNRDTGVPVFPVEERPVPQSDVPGEVTSPTQPFPARAAALVPQKLSADDAWGITDEDRDYCRERVKRIAQRRNFYAAEPERFAGDSRKCRRDELERVGLRSGARLAAGEYQ